MGSSAQKPAAKPRWGDLDEDDGKEALELDSLLLLPPKSVIGPDKNGIKKLIEYKFNDEGNMVKVTTTIRVRKISKTLLTKAALERRSWPKFGDAARDEGDDAKLTLSSNEDIFMDRPRAAGSKEEEDEIPQKGGVLKLCRTCGKKGEHWTAECRYKDLASPPQTADGVQDVATSKPPPGSSKYVPPVRRLSSSDDHQGRPNRHNNDESSVRVGNLSEDATEDDIRELFGHFGPLGRVHVVRDKISKESKGFAFVSFFNRQDAKTAINKLHGYGYDNLILTVDWAPPKTVN